MGNPLNVKSSCGPGGVSVRVPAQGSGGLPQRPGVPWPSSEGRTRFQGSSSILPCSACCLFPSVSHRLGLPGKPLLYDLLLPKLVPIPPQGAITLGGAGPRLASEAKWALWVSFRSSLWVSASLHWSLAVD